MTQQQHYETVSMEELEQQVEQAVDWARALDRRLLEPSMQIQPLNVYQRLNQARLKFHQLQLKKTGHNKFAGYHYFELGDFLIPALQVFADAGLCAVVTFGEQFAQMRILNTENPEDSIVISSPMGSASLKGCHEVQNIGAVETYQRRYLWVAALEIVEHDALDSSPPKEEPKQERQSFRSSPTMGAMEMIEDEERKTYLQMLGTIVTNKVSKGEVEQAHAAIEKEKFDSDEKTALWSLLDSKTRSALKRHGESLKAAK